MTWLKDWLGRKTTRVAIVAVITGAIGVWQGTVQVDAFADQLAALIAGALTIYLATNVHEAPAAPAAPAAPTTKVENECGSCKDC